MWAFLEQSKSAKSTCIHLVLLCTLLKCVLKIPTCLQYTCITQHFTQTHHLFPCKLTLLFCCCFSAENPAAATSNPIPAIAMPQLPPEPAGRCSNKLQVFI